MQTVKQILVDANKVAQGVVLQDGTEIRSKVVLSNATAKVTFIDMLEKVSHLYKSVGESKSPL